MKISVLGASGQTGLSLVSQALKQGHEVKALVRDVSKITIQHENLKVCIVTIFFISDYCFLLPVLFLITIPIAVCDSIQGIL